MRQVEQRPRPPHNEARLEYAEASRGADRPAGIGQADRSDALFAPVTDAPGEERQHQRRAEENEDPRTLVEQDRVLSEGPDVIGRCVARSPLRVLNRLNCSLASLVVSEQRKRRQEHRGGQKKLFHARIERLQPQPEMQPEATVNPDDQQ
jgi:hypothetical protein